MNDSNGKTIRTGDFVKISGAYFKNSNGIFLVERGDDAPGDRTPGDIWLHRVKKSGELTVNSGTNSESWPLRSYCSDSRKNREARQHNAEHAKIELAEGVNTSHAAEHFRKEAENAAESAERQRRNGWEKDAAQSEDRSAFYAAVAARLAATAEQPKEKEPETGIKFYRNGIKVDGGRLIPCHYSIDNSTKYKEGVTIYAREYSGDLPSKYFIVQNNSDGMTDYFETDRADVLPEHPLYKYVRYVAYKARAKQASKCVESYKKQLAGREPWPGHFDSLRERIAQEEKYIADFEKMKDPGQPTAADLAAVEEMKTAQESARLAAEHAAQLAEREKCLRKISEGRHYMERVAAEHPVTNGAPTVEIGFSESPYLYSLSHGAENVFSVAAAEIILKHFDEMKHAENAGYDKTDFIIRWTDEKTGEAHTYEGRYDLGDNDGGLIEHIRAFGRCCIKDEQEKAEICELADWLQTFTDGGRVVSVEIAPGVVDLLAYRKQQEQAKRENAKREWADIMAAVQMLTDEQIEAAVFCVDPHDKGNLDVARFFLQELSRRDEKKALEVFKRWYDGAGA